MEQLKYVCKHRIAYCCITCLGIWPQADSTHFYYLSISKLHDVDISWDEVVELVQVLCHAVD
jgi:hypothetical protein